MTETPYSFKYIKLGVGLVFLLASSIIPGYGQYMFLALGGIALITAFASFGNYDNSGHSKLYYKIGRYLLAALIIYIGVIQIYFAISLLNLYIIQYMRL